MSWKPRNEVRKDGQFMYYGTVNDKDIEKDVDEDGDVADVVPIGSQVFVYGPKTEKGTKQAQSRRKLCFEIFVKMIRGKLGVGTPGEDALLPLDAPRSVVDLKCFNDPDYHLYEDYASAVRFLQDEGVNIPAELAVDDTIDA
jgi:hypothetical protein